MKRLFFLLVALMCVTAACANSSQEEEMNITVTNSEGKTNSLNAILAKNKSAEAFYALLKKGALTVNMEDYASFEKVGSLGISLPRTDTQITTEAGDIILYQGNQITIYYDTNRWNFTRLGKITGVTKDQLREILGSESVTVVFACASK